MKTMEGLIARLKFQLTTPYIFQLTSFSISNNFNSLEKVMLNQFISNIREKEAYVVLSLIAVVFFYYYYC